MTEAEWLGCTDPEAMIGYLVLHPSKRKWRLLTVACWRRYRLHLPEDPEYWEIVEGNEVAADDPSSPVAEKLANADMLVQGKSDAEEWAITGAWGLNPHDLPGERVGQAALVREVFGNPFRPVNLDRAWKTPTILALAHAAYENRTLPARTLEPARLAVLADALEDAGCDNADILNHCRQPGEHVRGCWVLDLLTGRN